MEELYINIINRIAAEVPELSLIDEDYGQLEMSAEDDAYPVTYPCVLIGNDEIEWEDLTGDTQRGRASLTVRLAIDCYHDTHYTSGTYDHVRERRRLLRKVYRALYRFRAAPNASALTRVRSRGYSMPHGIKVSEMTFAFRVSDQV
jgi:hypothetical protein